MTELVSRDASGRGPEDECPDFRMRIASLLSRNEKLALQSLTLAANRLPGLTVFIALNPLPELEFWTPSMAKTPDRVLDVCIVETKAVYTAVPFAVVVDWIQQGRLLGDDRVRLAGNEKWHLISNTAALSAYLPKPEPLETHAAAEALEPVDLGWNWKHPGEEDDDDVDMIPLIDISLVLLIFFMMTATISSGIVAPIADSDREVPRRRPRGTNRFGSASKSKSSAGRSEDAGRPYCRLGREER